MESTGKQGQRQPDAARNMQRQQEQETLTGTYIKTDKERQRLTQADKYRQTGKDTQKDKGKQID